MEVAIRGIGRFVLNRLLRTGQEFELTIQVGTHLTRATLLAVNIKVNPENIRTWKLETGSRRTVQGYP